ncbi:MAG: Transcriptional regulator, AcrR family, partial [uncultured Rubrobacteraceae bacterium]
GQEDGIHAPTHPRTRAGDRERARPRGREPRRAGRAGGDVQERTVRPFPVQ